jgi:hypothetical protein
VSVRTLLILVAGVTLGAVLGFLLTFSPTAGGPQGVPVWLEVVQRVCTSVGGLGTAAALLYVARQFNLLRQQSDLVQKNVLASLDGQLYARLDALNRLIVEHDEEYEMLDTLRVGEEQPGHRATLHHLCDLGFTFYEQIFKHHTRYGLLETEDWEEWRQSMAHYFGKTYVRGYWQAVRSRYAKRFRDLADALAAGAGSRRDVTG